MEKEEGASRKNSEGLVLRNELEILEKEKGALRKNPEEFKK